MAFNYKTEYNRYKRYYQAVGEMTAKPKNRAYTTVVLTFLAISLFAWYAVLPTIRTILYLRREIADKLIVNKKMEEKIAALIEAQAAYQGLKQKLPLLTEAVPKNPDVLILVAQLKNIATQNSASLSAIQIPTVPLFLDTEPLPLTESSTKTPNKSAQNVPTEKPYTGARRVDVPISITVNGSYASILSFLEDVRMLRRIVGINGLSITPLHNTVNTATGSSTQLEVVLKLTLYYLTTEPVRN